MTKQDRIDDDSPIEIPSHSRLSESDAGISPESPGVILVPPPYSETTDVSQTITQEIELVDTRQEKLQVNFF